MRAWGLLRKVLGFAEFNWVLLGFIEFYWGLRGFGKV